MQFYTVAPLHMAMSEILYWYAPVQKFQKASRSEVAFTQGYRNKPSEPVQNRFKIRMVRKANQKSGRFANVPFHWHMSKKGRSSSGPLSGPAGFLWVHASAFHLLSPSILEKLSFPAEVPVFFFIFRNKLVNFNLSPGDFRSWESPQTLLALFIGSFQHVERFRNLKFCSYKDHRHSEYCSKLFWRHSFHSSCF